MGLFIVGLSGYPRRVRKLYNLRTNRMNIAKKINYTHTYCGCMGVCVYGCVDKQ